MIDLYANTGRTQRMLEEAVEKAVSENLAVVAANEESAEDLATRFQEMTNSQGSSLSTFPRPAKVILPKHGTAVTFVFPDRQGTIRTPGVVRLYDHRVCHEWLNSRVPTFVGDYVMDLLFLWGSTETQIAMRATGYDRMPNIKPDEVPK